MEASTSPFLLREESINVVVLGTETSSKHRFVSSFVGRSQALSPLGQPVVMRKRLVMNSSTAFTINLDTNICGFWGISDQVIRTGDRFIFVYNTASRASFEEFKFIREKLMATLIDREQRKGSMDQFLMGWRLPLMIVGYHKNDKLRQVPTSEGKRYSEYYKCAFKEVRQDDAKGVEECIRDMLADENNFISASQKVSQPFEREAPDDVSNMREFEIAVMGDLFVGKTCLIRKLITNTFHPRYVSTAEEHKQRYRLTMDTKSVILRLTDTPGTMSLDSLTKEYLLPTQGFILVYSVTSRPSFDRLTELYPPICKHKTETKLPHVIVILGNKSDEHVSFEEGNQLARQLGSALFFELSAKDESVEEVFAQCVRALQARETNRAPLTQSPGELEKAGSLMMMDKRRWRTRTFVVREGTLNYSSNSSIGTARGSFPLVGFTHPISIKLTPGVVVKELPPDPKVGFPFDISSTDYGEVWNLAASSLDERSAWVASIRLNAGKGKAEEGINFMFVRSDEIETRKPSHLNSDITSPAGFPLISHSIMEFTDLNSSKAGSLVNTHSNQMYAVPPLGRHSSERWRSHEVGLFGMSPTTGSPIMSKKTASKVTSLWRRDTKKKKDKEDKKHNT